MVDLSESDINAGTAKNRLLNLIDGEQIKGIYLVDDGQLEFIGK